MLTRDAAVADGSAATSASTPPSLIANVKAASVSVQRDEGYVSRARISTRDCAPLQLKRDRRQMPDSRLSILFERMSVRFGLTSHVSASAETRSQN